MTALRRISTEPSWTPVGTQGEGLPTKAGVYRFSVPREADSSEHIEFLALVRWRKHGVHQLLFPTFEYIVCDENIVLPEGTCWREREPWDPDTLGETEFIIVPEMSAGAQCCPFCKEIPRVVGDKYNFEFQENYITKMPHRFNRLWFRCCKWVAPVPTSGIQSLITAWNKMLGSSR